MRAARIVIGCYWMELDGSLDRGLAKRFYDLALQPHHAEARDTLEQKHHVQCLSTNYEIWRIGVFIIIDQRSKLSDTAATETTEIQ